MICDNNKEFKSKRFIEKCIKLRPSEIRHVGVKGGLKNKKRQYISKMKIRHYNLQIISCPLYEY